MGLLRRCRSVCLAGITAILMLSGCSSSDSQSGSSTSSFELGESELITSSTVPVSGGQLIVEDEGSPLNGLELNIPAGAYPDARNVSISYAPINSHSGNEYLDPVTPLIQVENGGDYADEVMTFKIPVEMETGYHYMAFYYDEETGNIEGIPELTHDEESITIATRHFSRFWVNKMAIAKALIYGSYGSDYAVGQDNWQFGNYGSYLSPGGICSGMSLTSLYYYNEKRKKSGYSPLFESYNNGTSGFDLDDDQGIKFASTAQYYEGNFQGLTYQYWYNMGRAKDDVWTYFMFMHSLLLTQEPQYVSIFPADGNIGHALVVYKKAENGLFVADPNSPEDDSLKIEFKWEDGDSFTSGEFKPYESKWNTGSNKVDFSEIFYIGKTAIVDWKALDEQWQKLENNQAGEDFPDYELKVIASGSAAEEDLTQGFKTNSQKVQIKVSSFEFDARINVRYEAIPMLLDNNSDTIEVSLEPGLNRLGLYIEAERYSDVTKETDWTWTDFQYVTIEYEESDACVVGEWTYFKDEQCTGEFEQHPRPWSINADGSSLLDALQGRWTVTGSELAITHPVDPNLIWNASIKNSCSLLEGEQFYDSRRTSCWKAERN